MVFQLNQQRRINLSSQELLTISEKINRHYAPHFIQPRVSRLTSAAFSTQELLNISQEISREYTPLISGNQSQLVLLPIEPNKLHAYWQFALQQPTQLTTAIEEKQLSLRIYHQENTDQNLLNSEHPKTEIPEQWLDIKIDLNKNQQDILLPTEFTNHNTISAIIGYHSESQDFTPILSSKPIAMPKFNTVNYQSALPASVAEFMVLAKPTSSYQNNLVLS